MMRSNRFKKVIFGALLMVLSLIILEAAVLVAYGLFKHQLFPYTKYRSLIHSVAASTHGVKDIKDPGVVHELKPIVHPYFGYTFNPNGKWISEYGFIDPNLSSPIPPPAKGLTAAVLGGSFATLTCIHAEKHLIEQLSALGSPVRIVNLALGGYKQPQQLIILTYLLSLGAHFDLVINIDGFNEVALPTAENMPNGVFPLYPRQWHLLMADVHDPEIKMKLLLLDKIREEERQLAAFFDGLPSRSAVGCLIWRAINRNIQQKKYEAESDIARTPAGSRPFVTGPPFSAKTETDVYTYLANHWARCSLLMNDICQTNGIRYFHFLQPNQYLAGSKPMGAREKKIAIYPDHPYRPGVVQGYPILRKTGEQLLKNIEFHDMTMIFSNHNELLYNDACCHLNEKGYAIFANAIDRIIVDAAAAGIPSSASSK